MFCHNKKPKGGVKTTQEYNIVTAHCKRNRGLVKSSKERFAVAASGMQMQHERSNITALCMSAVEAWYRRSQITMDAVPSH